MDLLTAPNYYAQLRKTDSTETKKSLSESTVEGVHATLCSILSDVVEGGFLTHNPAWHTYRYAGRKLERKVADEETAQQIISFYLQVLPIRTKAVILYRKGSAAHAKRKSAH